MFAIVTVCEAATLALSVKKPSLRYIGTATVTSGFWCLAACSNPFGDVLTHLGAMILLFIVFIVVEDWADLFIKRRRGIHAESI